MTTKMHRDFRTLVANLKADGVTDQVMHDSLGVFMDKHGVPMMLAEEYRDVPAIVALFAERGVYLMTPEEKAGLEDGSQKPWSRLPYCFPREQKPAPSGAPASPLTMVPLMSSGASPSSSRGVGLRYMPSVARTTRAGGRPLTFCAET